MNRFMKVAMLLAVALMVLAVVPMASAQDGIETLCLVTDLGRVNDGTFNQFAHEGAVRVADDYELEYRFIETQAETDYVANINTCVEEGFEAIITVGFLIADATLEAAAANPDTYFIGIDQDVSGMEEVPENYVGILFREDQAGFLAGALAALWANESEADIIAGVYGVDIPPVKRFRNGYEQGALYINPDWEIGTNILGVYIPDFLAPDRGASAAEQFIGEGAFIIFGAGGPTGSGAIQAAAQQDVFVIGVDQDEYLTTFGEGETPGAEYIITSAQKRVDEGVYLPVAALAEGDVEGFGGGGNLVLDAELGGVGIAPAHEAEVPEELYEQVDEILEMLVAGDVETGVDPVSGDLMDDMMEEDMESEDMEEESEESSG